MKGVKCCTYSTGDCIMLSLSRKSKRFARIFRPVSVASSKVVKSRRSWHLSTTANTLTTMDLIPNTSKKRVKFSSPPGSIFRARSASHLTGQAMHSLTLPIFRLMDDAISVSTGHPSLTSSIRRALPQTLNKLLNTGHHVACE